MLVTLLVSQLAISNSVRAEHSANMYSMFCTFSFLKSSNFIFLAVDWRKNPLREVGFDVNFTTTSFAPLFKLYLIFFTGTELNSISYQVPGSSVRSESIDSPLVK